MPFTTLRKSTDHLFFLRNPEKIFLGTINYPIGKLLIVSMEFFIKLAPLSTYTAWKVSQYEIFSGPYFPVFGQCN